MCVLKYFHSDSNATIKRYRLSPTIFGDAATHQTTDTDHRVQTAH